MRRFMVFAIAMMVSVGMVSDAEAGKKKKKSRTGAQPKYAPVLPKRLHLTYFRDLDVSLTTSATAQVPFAGQIPVYSRAALSHTLYQYILLNYLNQAAMAQAMAAGASSSATTSASSSASTRRGRPPREARPVERWDRGEEIFQPRRETARRILLTTR